VLTYITRRILYSIPVLAVSSFISFTFVALAGDPLGNLRANPRTTAGILKHLEHVYHLDRSIPVRYWYWVQDVFTHKLGVSLNTSQPIWPDIERAMGHTAQVILIAQLIALVLGVAVGIFSAIRQYSIFDYTFTSISFLGYAMPTFWLALLLQILFVDIYLKWHVRIFYTSGLNSHGSATWSLDRLQHIALPVATLSIVSFALYSRFMRASMLDVINTDYVRTARAKGLPERLVIMRHVFRNALIPIVTVMGPIAVSTLMGSIVVENAFGVPGLGPELVRSIFSRDYFMATGIFTYYSLLAGIAMLGVDLAYTIIDPKIRY